MSDREDDESRRKMERMRANPRVVEASRKAKETGQDPSYYDVYDPDAKDRPDPNREVGDSMDEARAYVPPTALPAKTRRDTLEVQAKVEIAPHLAARYVDPADPRRRPTQRRVGADEDQRPTLPKLKDPISTAAMMPDVGTLPTTPLGPPVVLSPPAAPFAPQVMPTPEQLLPEPAPAAVAEPNLTSEVFIGVVKPEGAENRLQRAPEASRWAADAEGGFDRSALPSAHAPRPSDPTEIALRRSDHAPVALPASRPQQKHLWLAAVAAAVVLVPVLAFVLFRSGPATDETTASSTSARLPTLATGAPTAAATPEPEPAATPAPAMPETAAAATSAAPAPPSTSGKPRASGRPTAAPAPTATPTPPTEQTATPPPAPKPSATFKDVF